jgi:hypothetical protein
MLGSAESDSLRGVSSLSQMRKDENMNDENALQRCTIFLEKSRGSRPWRLSVRSLNGSGLFDRLYGNSDLPLTDSQVDSIVTDVTTFVRQFCYVHGVQYSLPGSAAE